VTNALGLGGGTPRREGRKDARQDRREDRRNPQQTTTTTIVPTPEQTETAQLGLDKVKNFQPPDFTQSVAPFNQTQQSAQQLALMEAILQQQLAGQGGQAQNFLFGPALFPETNPALQQTIQAANEAARRNFTSNTLPAIRSDAVLSGNYGGSRQGIAEGIAARDFQRDASDRAAQISTAGYGQGLEAFTNALGFLPQTVGAQTIPGQTAAAVGDVQQDQSQRVLDAQQLNAMFPWYQGQDLIGLSQGLPGGSTTVSQPAPRQGFLSNILGGASTGAALFPGRPIASAIAGGLTGAGSYLLGR